MCISRPSPRRGIRTATENGDTDSPQEATNPDAQSDYITRGTSVRDAWKFFAEEPVVVSRGTALRDVAEILGQRRGIHTVAVIDDKGRLVGVIPLRLLLDEMFFHIAPEEFLADIRSDMAIEEFGRISHADTVDDVMQKPAYVTVDETVDDAYGCMHENRLEGLPIVDESMKPIGYVDRFQLLRTLLQTSSEK